MRYVLNRTETHWVFSAMAKASKAMKNEAADAMIDCLKSLQRSGRSGYLDILIKM